MPEIKGDRHQSFSNKITDLVYIAEEDLRNDKKIIRGYEESPIIILANA